MNSPSSGPQQRHQRQEPKMLLGKRPRPAPSNMMRRTRSMGGITLAGEADDALASDDPQQLLLQHDPPHPQHDPHAMITGAKGFDEHDERLVMPPPPPPPPSSSTTTTTTSNLKYSSSHVMLTAHFLRTCALCKRGLATGRDIYMYRGDTAFCSLECREKQMRQDEKKEKRKVPSNKDVHR